MTLNKTTKNFRTFLNKDLSLSKKKAEKTTENKETTGNKKTPKTIDIKDLSMEDIQENPENFLEINIIRDTKIIETIYIYAKDKKFTYDDKEYDVDHDRNLHNPKGNYVIPTAFYKEGEPIPIDFKNMNKGIPSKVLSLLYDTRLYRILIQPETGNLNWILIIVTIIQIVMMGIVVWGLWNNGYLNF